MSKRTKELFVKVGEVFVIFSSEAFEMFNVGDEREIVNWLVD